MDKEQIILEEETLWRHFANEHKLPLELGMSDKGGKWRPEELVGVRQHGMLLFPHTTNPTEVILNQLI